MAAHDRFGWSQAEIRVAGIRVGVTTAWGCGPVDDRAVLDALYGGLASRLRHRGHVPVHEKAFGLRALAPAADDARRRAYARAGVDDPGPTTWIEGRPCVGGSFAGLQAWSVALDEGVRVEPVTGDGGEGRLVLFAEGRLLFLTAVRGDAGGAADVPTELAQTAPTRCSPRTRRAPGGGRSRTSRR